MVDGIAAHAKGILNRTSRDENTPIRTVESAIQTIQKLGNHSPSSAHVASNDFTSKTLKGIKKYFKYTFSTEEEKVYAYLDSSQQEASREFHPNKVLEFLDIV
jgi:hypothetical protein